MEKNIQKVNVESLNLTEEKRRALKELFPEAFPDNILNIETLIDIIEPDNEEEENILNEHYGLFWPGKKAARKNARTPTQGAIAPLKGKGVDEDKTKNIFIEGENLEVLKLLQKSYAGKIKLIYIDPPYNTGNDFIYKDKFSEGINEYYKKSKQVDEEGNLLTSNPKTSGRYHANWLSMMYPRLELAKNLLSDDGVIFVSIDDNEVHNLRHLMDEIFGQGNFCGKIKRRAARKTAFLSKTMSDLCDYIVIYSKGDLTEALSVEQVSDGTRPVFNEGNKDSLRILPKGTISKCPDGRYKSGKYSVRTLSFTLLNDLVIKNGVTTSDVEILAPWRVNQEIINKTIFITKNFGFRRNVLEEELEKKKALSDLLDNPDCYNEKGSEELTFLFNNEKGVFDNPKPIGLIQYILKASGIKNNDIVLDFFSGSGTTMHATLLENSINDISFNSICIQLPLNITQDSTKFETISDLAIERIQRSIKKIKKENPTKISTNNDLGFKCFTLKETNFKTFPSKPLSKIADLEKLFEDSQDVLKDGWKKEDVLWEILLQEGFPLHSNIIEEKKILKNLFYRVSSDWCTHELLISLDEKIDTKTEQDLLNLQKLEIEKDFILILRDCALFRNDKIKINLAETFKIRSL